MNRRPRLLDLFCCAGGAGTGYHFAGFDVVGVDIEPQPRYPFLFVQGDALQFVRRNARHFDAVHASPPCQAHTTMSNRWRGKGTKADSHIDFIAPTRAALEATGLPYVIENVTGARRCMRNPILLSGGMFGLRVERPRLFESSARLIAPTRRKAQDPIGVYGRAPDGGRLNTRRDGTIQRRARSLEEAQGAMAIGWMAWPELVEAIPPAYTQFIGRQLIGAALAHAARRLAA